MILITLNYWHSNTDLLLFSKWSSSYRKLILVHRNRNSLQNIFSYFETCFIIVRCIISRSKSRSFARVVADWFVCFVLFNTMIMKILFRVVMSRTRTFESISLRCMRCTRFLCFWSKINFCHLELCYPLLWVCLTGRQAAEFNKQSYSLHQCLKYCQSHNSLWWRFLEKTLKWILENSYTLGQALRHNLNL